MEATREETKVSRIVVDVDRDLHRGLKMLAAQKETTLRELVSAVMRTHLEEQAPDWSRKKAS